MMTGSIRPIRRWPGFLAPVHWRWLALFLAFLSSPALAQEDRTFGTDVLPPLVEEATVAGILSPGTITPEMTVQMAAERLDLMQNPEAVLPTENETVVLQGGLQNKAIIEQAGAGNLAIMYQEGERIIQTLTQLGDHNLFGSWIIGNDNVLELVQQGNRNVYLFGLEGNGYDLGHTIQQLGDDNVVIQVGSGTPFSVEQNGSGMQMTITHQ